jgi:hypothetical protein
MLCGKFRPDRCTVAFFSIETERVEVQSVKERGGGLEGGGDGEGWSQADESVNYF